MSSTRKKNTEFRCVARTCCYTRDSRRSNCLFLSISLDVQLADEVQIPKIVFTAPTRESQFPKDEKAAQRPALGTRRSYILLVDSSDTDDAFYSLMEITWKMCLTRAPAATKGASILLCRDITSCRGDWSSSGPHASH